MTAAYKPVPSSSTEGGQNNNGDDIERGGDYTPRRPPCMLTVPQRQVVGIFLFFGLLCLWISLKMMENTNHHPLLRTTNTLLNTNDLYQSLTLPLLELSNRTSLISSRCSTTSLPPHLLSFVGNDLSDQQQEEEGEKIISPQIDPVTNKTVEIPKPLRYLIGLVVQDSKVVLPDLLSRVLEVIAVLGPDNCHLSIVDHASKDQTGEMLKVLTRFLDRYNEGDVEILGGMNMESSNSNENMSNMSNMKHKESDNNNGSNPTTKENEKKRRHHLTYTFKTLATRDNSPQNMVKIRNMVMNPHSDVISVLEGRDENSVIVVRDKKRAVRERGEEVLFDSVIVMDPVITCSEDILELVFQSQLQDADLTCGMDLGLVKEQVSDTGSSGTSAVPSDEEEYDTTITMDMLGQRLHSDSQQPSLFSTDPETQERFQKRLPFQVESCWSSVVVLRASSLLLMNQNSQLFHLKTVQQIQDPEQKGKECQLLDDRVTISYDLWDMSKVNSLGQSSPQTPRMVVVPAIAFTHTPKNYAHLGRFTGWGLWPKSDKKYRDELEAQLKAAIHPMYGYKASTSSYGYISRVEEDETSLLTLKDDDESKDKNVKENIETERVNDSMERLMVSEEATTALKLKLEEIAAVFGVQDIQNAVMAKRETELIDEWRNRQQAQRIEC